MTPRGGRLVYFTSVKKCLFILVGLGFLAYGVQAEEVAQSVAEVEIAEMREEIKREGALIISNAQREAMALDQKMEEIRRLAAEVTNVANNSKPA